MTKRILPLLLMLLMATASGAHRTQVDGVTGATQTTSAAAQQKAAERRVKKALARLTANLDADGHRGLQALVTVKGKSLAHTNGWKGNAPQASKMREASVMNFRTTLAGHDEVLAYHFLKQEGGEVCAVSLPNLEACVYLSYTPNATQNVASAVHRYVAPTLEDILSSDSESD